MKKIIGYILGVLFIASIVYAAGGYNAGVYHEQGGDRVVVSSTGSLDVESSGEIDIESGGSLKLSGTAITSTAGELNILDGVTATSAEVEVLAAASQLSDGLLAKKIARATLDCDAASACTVGTVALGQTLPAKSLLTKSWLYIITQFTEGSSGTVAIHCEDADNVFTAANVVADSPSGSIVAGNQDGTNTDMQAGIESACELTATIATAEQTSGTMNVFVEYVVTD